MPTFYGPPSDGTVIPQSLEDALASDLGAPESPIGGAVRDAFHRFTGSGGDATAELQAAINAAAAAGQPLYLTRMFYTVSASITLPDDLVLEGNGATLQALPGTDAHVIVNADPTNGNSGIELRNLKVDGNVENQTVPFSVVYLTRVEHSRFINLDCQGGRRGTGEDRKFGEGIEFVYSNYNELIGGAFHHNYYDGIKLRTSHHNTFSGFKCYDNARGGVQVSYEYPHTNEGVFEAGSNYNTFTNFVVTHSTGTPGGAWVPTTSGFYVHGGSFNTISNFVIYGPGQGIGVWADSSDNTWSNGVIRTRYNSQARAAIDMEGGPSLPSHRNTFADIKIAPLSGADGKYLRVSAGSTGHRFVNVQMYKRDGTGDWTIDDVVADTVYRNCVRDGVVVDNAAGGTLSGPVAHLSAFNGATGAVPYGWATRWNQAGGTWTEDAAGFLRLVKTGNGRCALGNQVAGDFANVEVLARVRTDTAAAGSTPVGLIVRGGGAATAETGYFVNFSEVGTRINITRYAAGASSTPSVVTTAWAANEWQWMRVRVTGTGDSVVIQARHWADGTAEPSAWTISYTDTSTSRVTGAGWVGVGNFSAATVDYDDLSIRRL